MSKKEKTVYLEERKKKILVAMDSLFNYFRLHPHLFKSNKKQSDSLLHSILNAKGLTLTEEEVGEYYNKFIALTF